MHYLGVSKTLNKFIFLIFLKEKENSLLLNSRIILNAKPQINFCKIIICVHVFAWILEYLEHQYKHKLLNCKITENAKIICLNI